MIQKNQTLSEYECFRNALINLFHSCFPFYVCTSVIYDKIYFHISLKELFQIVPIEIPGDKKDLCHSLNGSILPLHKIMAYIAINGIADSMKYNMNTCIKHQTSSHETNRIRAFYSGARKSENILNLTETQLRTDMLAINYRLILFK